MVCGEIPMYVMVSHYYDKIIITNKYYIVDIITTQCQSSNFVFIIHYYDYYKTSKTIPYFRKTVVNLTCIGGNGLSQIRLTIIYLFAFL